MVLAPLLILSMGLVLSGRPAAQVPAEPSYQGKTVQQWVAALKNKDWFERHFAARTLGRIGPPARKAVPALIVAVQDPERWVRNSAVWALGKIGPAAKPAVPRLKASLTCGDHMIQDSAAIALKEIGTLPTEPVPALIAVLVDRDAPVWQGAAASLEEVTGAGFDRQGSAAQKARVVCLRALGDNDPTVRHAAARCLDHLGLAPTGAVPKEVIAGLLTALKDSQPGVRKAAAAGLGQCGVSWKEVVMALAALMQDPDNETRAAAAGSLGNLGQAAREAAPQLLVAMYDPYEPESKVFEAAAKAWRQLTATGKKPSDVITEALAKAREPAVRRSAAHALGLRTVRAEIGLEAAAAAPALNRALLDGDPSVRRVAAEALGQLGPAAREAVSRLVQALQDRDEGARWAAAAALEQIGSVPKEAKATVAVILKESVEGTWRFVSGEANGEKSSEAPGLGGLWAHLFFVKAVLIKGNKVEIIGFDGKSDTAGVLRVDPGKRPMTVDITPAPGWLPVEGLKPPLLGVFARRGNTLTVCVSYEPGGKRPTEFTTGPWSQRVLLVFRRIEP
jgi:uncharacterized protein (TIGR03067 family)